MENYFGWAVITMRHNNYRDTNGLFNSEMIWLLWFGFIWTLPGDNSNSMKLNKWCTDLQIHLSKGNMMQQPRFPLICTEIRRHDSTHLAAMHQRKTNTTQNLSVKTTPLVLNVTTQWWSMANVDNQAENILSQVNWSELEQDQNVNLQLGGQRRSDSTGC